VNGISLVEGGGSELSINSEQAREENMKTNSFFERVFHQSNVSTVFLSI